MDKKYIIDIKRNDKSNDFVLNISNVNKLRTLDLDINNCLISYKKALGECNLERASEILSVLKELTEYGDKRFSDINILYKLNEIILFYKDMNKEDIIRSMEILLKIRSFFRFLNGEINFEYNEENTHLIDNIKDIKKSIIFKDLLIDDFYKNRDISILDFETILEFKKAFINEKEYYMEEVCNFFETKLYDEIKRAVLEKNIECYKNILRDKYEEDYYKSQEFQRLVNKNNMTNYKSLITVFNNTYLLYKYNKEIINKKKENILMEILIGNFINLPKIYRLFVVESIINDKSKYLDINSFFHSVNKKLEEIRENRCLNTIIV